MLLGILIKFYFFQIFNVCFREHSLFEMVFLETEIYKYFLCFIFLEIFFFIFMYFDNCVSLSTEKWFKTCFLCTYQKYPIYQKLFKILNFTSLQNVIFIFPKSFRLEYSLFMLIMVHYLQDYSINISFIASEIQNFEKKTLSIQKNDVGSIGNNPFKKIIDFQTNHPEKPIYFSN